MIIENSTLIDKMLIDIAAMISDGLTSNYIYITASDDTTILTKLKFSNVEYDATNQYLIFEKSSGTYKLISSVLEDGVASRFYIFRHDDNDFNTGVKVLSGTVGGVSDLDADIKFSTVDWVRGNSVSLTSIKISLEDVCLHQ